MHTMGERTAFSQRKPVAWHMHAMERGQVSLILHHEPRSGATMKMKATIEVEFEAGDGQTGNVLESALTRGVGALCTAIEYGSLTGAPSGVKSGSVIASIQKKEITD
jgi:hypothetical protein